VLQGISAKKHTYGVVLMGEKDSFQLGDWKFNRETGWDFSKLLETGYKPFREEQENLQRWF